MNDVVCENYWSCGSVASLKTPPSPKRGRLRHNKPECIQRSDPVFDKAPPNQFEASLGWKCYDN